MDEDDEVFTLIFTSSKRYGWTKVSNIELRIGYQSLITCRFSTDNSSKLIVSFNTLLFFVISNDICK